MINIKLDVVQVSGVIKHFNVLGVGTILMIGSISINKFFFVDQFNYKA